MTYKELKSKAISLQKPLEEKMHSLNFSGALSIIWEVINKANKYIEQTKPWEYSKAKDEESLKYIICNLLEALRIVAISIYPFMPTTSENTWKQLGIKGSVEKASLELATKWNQLKPKAKIAKAKPLFPRISSK